MSSSVQPVRQPPAARSAAWLGWITHHPAFCGGGLLGLLLGANALDFAMARWETPTLFLFIGFILGGGLLGLLALGVYAAALTHEFLCYDDPVYVTENLRVQAGLTWPNVVWAFTTSEAEFWHPLTWLSHLFDCSCWGLKPGGHHLTSILFHLANTLLVFVVFRRMTGTFWRSWLVAALFGGSHLQVSGPTGAMTVVLLPVIARHGADKIPLLSARMC